MKITKISVRVGRKFVPHPKYQFQPLNLEVELEGESKEPEQGTHETSGFSERSDSRGLTKEERTEVAKEAISDAVDGMVQATREMYPDLFSKGTNPKKGN